MITRVLLGISAVYFLLGIALGLHMGLIADYRLWVVYAHIGGLGWLSLGLVGAIYLARPALSQNVFAILHFWMHMIGLPVMLIGLTMTQLDAFATGHLLGVIGAVMLLIGALALAINFWINATRDARHA
jgi:cbb3-type cytochrome oxidase subunit 1